MSDAPNIVLDLGSAWHRAGFAGEDAPRTVYKNIVGVPRYPTVMVGMGLKSRYVGNEATEKRGICNISYPMEHGIVKDWDKMESTFHHSFYNLLRVAPEEHAVLVTEHVLNPRKNRARLLEVLFETFNVQGAYVALPEVLQLYAAAHLGGTCVSVGDGVLSVVQILEGYMLPFADRVDFGGRDLTQYLATLLKKQGVYMNRSTEMELVEDIKDKLSYVAESYDDELYTSECSAALWKTYTLPDGHHITLNHERFQCMEPLFYPSLVEKDLPGIHELILKNAMLHEKDDRKFLWGGVFLSGGCARSPGFAKRLTNELNARLLGRLKARVIPEQSWYNTWIGGSILGCLSTFQNMWIDRKEYNEDPEGIGFRKCFSFRSPKAK